MNICTAVLVFALLSVTQLLPSASAAPITFTGAELAARGDVTFPGGTPTISGSSLILTAPSDLSVVFRLDLGNFDLNLGNVGLRLNLTRLSQAFGGVDHSFGVYLGDGVNFFGAAARDAGQIQLGGRQERVSISSNGQNIIRDALSVNSLRRVNVNLNVPYTLNVNIFATSGRAIVGGQLNNNNTEFFTTDRSFNLNSSDLSLIFSFVMARERVRVDSLTFTTGVTEIAVPAIDVPAPSVMGSMGLAGLSFFGWNSRRRKKK